MKTTTLTLILALAASTANAFKQAQDPIGVVGGDDIADIAAAGLDGPRGRTDAEGVFGTAEFVGVGRVEGGDDEEIGKTARPSQRCGERDGGRGADIDDRLGPARLSLWASKLASSLW